MASANQGHQSTTAGIETMNTTSNPSATAESSPASVAASFSASASASVASAAPPLSTQPTQGSSSPSSAQAPGPILPPSINNNDKHPSASHSRRRLHPQPHPPRIHTQFPYYNPFSLLDDSLLPRKQRYRHRHSLRHRDQSLLPTHSHSRSLPHFQLQLHLPHQQQQLQQQQQPQRLDPSLLDGDPNRSKPVVSSKQQKEKRRYRHKRHASRDGQLPRTVRDHASMSLRPGKYVNRDKGSRINGVGELSVAHTVAAGQRSEASGLEASDSGSGTTEERLPFGRRRENVTMAEVRRERMWRIKEEESNRTTLSDLSTLSTNITRRLDTTYYALLEKISNLHSAIYSFHTLSTAASSLHSDFTRETDNLSRDTTAQIDEFHTAFTAQIQRIEVLEGRMRAGAEKAAALNRRMEIVRGKIEAWDRREGEWQRRVTTRLRIFWAVVGTAVVVLVAALAVQQLRPVEGLAGLAGTGIGVGDLGEGEGVIGKNVSTGNSTCGVVGQGLRDVEDVWVSKSFETNGGIRREDDTCPRNSVQK
ncbi:uncharacterized protein BDCG_17812 [Blastomyces dermatitidis ER-3]|uniref:Uncharacterized protein n=1 Tax=Ajellomyces dermatitidis (strain ER-3 / ATCC MYA-2586) TaxID=559297 RepID=A0ABX2W0G1_AJEDR|nr:uncharacterized protein BDCG_17812 [Blastomyces dermatitidis ER-3]OAT02873.1 hypothetical protein BDCG_17812 [Blastomyces dermatitidis ER-3]